MVIVYSGPNGQILPMVSCQIFILCLHDRMITVSNLISRMGTSMI